MEQQNYRNIGQQRLAPLLQWKIEADVALELQGI